MTEEEARAEGHGSLQTFLDQFRLINSRKLQGPIDYVHVYAVEFGLLEKFS